MPGRIRAIGAEAIAIEHPHALAASSLPSLHRDPFDRLLVAQARLLGLTIITADPAITQYPVPPISVQDAASRSSAYHRRARAAQAACPQRTLSAPATAALSGLLVGRV